MCIENNSFLKYNYTFERVFTNSQYLFSEISYDSQYMVSTFYCYLCKMDKELPVNAQQKSEPVLIHFRFSVVGTKWNVADGMSLSPSYMCTSQIL